MKVYVDATEPGVILQALKIHCEGEGISIERVWLHKREGHGAKTRRSHPHYGRGGDFLVADRCEIPLVSIERKTMHDLARSTSMERAKNGTPIIFRQLEDLRANPVPILLLEGGPSNLYRRIEPKLLGLQFWCIRQGIGILTTTGPQATAHAIYLIARKLAEHLDQPHTRSPIPPTQPDEPHGGTT